MRLPTKGLLIGSVIALVAAGPGAAQNGTKFNAVDDWMIYRDFDPMGGTAVCTAYYKGDKSVQLNKGAIAFALNQKIGVNGYQLRWDENQISEVIRPGSSAFFLADAEFLRLQNSKRLRVQVTTLSNSVINYDIELKSVPQVIAALKAPNCNQ
jgi:hypothetical protein